ncbi:MAG TPA: copper resistance system multicopper oxidase [Parvularcula sp.]|nr:copper resistance system multicopper oxidase [Parvularcula sp.]
MISRRRVLYAGAGLSLGAGLLPAWAKSGGAGNRGIFKLAADEFDLTVGHAAVTIGGRSGHAIAVNGTLPGPLLRMREGETVTLRVRNTIDEDTSIHWHGLLLPFTMDGVPGVSFPGIKPGETFEYRFPVRQSGTYWYHSHSGFQEPMGLLGPLVIDPAGADPVAADREHLLVLSDWSFEHPHKVFARLKKSSEVYNFQRRTIADFVQDARKDGLNATIADRGAWGRMRMSATDIADVTGAAFSYLINGHATADNWTALFNAGERVRLRIINAAAMTIFNFRIPGLPMTVVAADGQYVRPVETDEIQVGAAETYDVVVRPEKAQVYALVAESIDRSGQAVATLAPEAGLVAIAPPLRARPILTHRDMGMDHGAADHGSMDHGAMTAAPQRHDHKQGVGVDMVATEPTNRLDEPGLGLESAPHRALRYSQLRSLSPNPDARAPEREIEIHLTGNMERYMWSFDGVKFSHVDKPILFQEGERVRVTLVNDTMMTHPIHLHGMFFELVVDDSDHKPRKNTVNVKPGEKLSFDMTADAVGDWAFHCHLLFHMHAGMMQVFSVLPRAPDAIRDAVRPAPQSHEGHH